MNTIFISAIFVPVIFQVVNVTKYTRIYFCTLAGMVAEIFKFEINFASRRFYVFVDDRRIKWHWAYIFMPLYSQYCCDWFMWVKSKVIERIDVCDLSSVMLANQILWSDIQKTKSLKILSEWLIFKRKTLHDETSSKSLCELKSE